MKKPKINIGILTVCLILALFSNGRDAQVKRESKVADKITFATQEVKLEDILTPPQGDKNIDFVEYYMEDVPKTR